MTGRPIIAIVAAFLGGALCTAASLIRAEVNPRRLTVGDVGEILLVSNKEPPRIEKLPELEWLTWLNNGVPTTGREFRRVLGKGEDRRFSARYRFRAVAEGKHRLPNLTAVEGTKRAPLSLGEIVIESRRILRDGKRVGLDELVFIRLSGDRHPLPTEAWVGEAIPLTVDVCIDSQLRVHDNTLNDQNNYFPSVDINNVSYRDFSEQNRYNSKMTYSPRVQERIDNRLTAVYRFRLVMLPVEPGVVNGSIRHQIPLVFSSRRGPNLDPFQVLMQTARVVPHNVAAQLKPIRVKQLPVPEADAGDFVGLIGDWQLGVDLARKEVTAGEDVELILTATGSGSLESFRPPELDFPGVQIYEPEIERSVEPKTELTVKWLLVPRQAGSKLPPLRLSTFVAETGKYRTQTFTPQLTVLESTSPQAAVPMAAPGSGDVPMLRREDRQQQHDILNVRTDAPAFVALPLWQNTAPMALLLIALGPLAFLLTIVVANRRERFAGNASLRRRREAKRRRPELLKTLEASDDAFAVVRSDVVPWLIEHLDLPRGTTVSELRQHLNDDDLVEILEAAQQGAFMPGGASALTGKDIAARLRRLSALLALTSLVGLTIAPQQARAATPMDTAAESYYAQDFAAAAEEYRALARNGADSWQLRYNLGNCLFRQGKYAEAVASYERALRLAPRQSDILQNLNFTRAQMGLPPAREHASLGAMIVATLDLMRPDEWLLLAAFGWFATFAGLAAFRWRRRPVRPWILLPVALTLIGGLAAFTQSRTTYRHGQAMVVALETATRPFPDAEKTTGSPLTAGREIRVLEERNEWTRVRVDDAEGWIPSDHFRRIW